MSSIIPSKTQSLHTPYSPEEAAAALRVNTRPRMFLDNNGRAAAFVPDSGGLPLVGTVEGASFHVCRSTELRTAFQPAASGRILSEGNGSRIELELRLPQQTRWGGGLLTVLLGLTCFSALAALLIVGNAEAWTSLLLSAGALAVIHSLLRIRFRKNTAALEQVLRNLLNATT